MPNYGEYYIAVRLLHQIQEGFCLWSNDTNGYRHSRNLSFIYWDDAVQERAE